MTREEAIRILDPETSNATLMEMMGGTWDRSMALKLCAQARNMVLQALREKQAGGWINVDDRLPEENDTFSEFIVMIAGAERPAILEYQGREWWADEEGNNYDVTHWQPLPEPPMIGE